ncbi:hypothetical protein KEM09_00295 [Carboxylicivirga mesophila]|uniref:Class IIb bacteriocin, lactobin A/cerein 7B family n=1 Tax=Carboxylicivirga mesophila TaxID=1166478 RepID=A0ABS5K4B9_9BACT|nr:hypothetical protein [Carboxylicivirga mesophila]MBS2209822.1 hypothetical protein [Carboxylicivirga mesophila]
MKNLNELGVQELDAKEMKKTDGGIIPLLIVAAVGWGTFTLRTAAVGAVAAVVADKVVDNYDKGYAEGNK